MTTVEITTAHLKYGKTEIVLKQGQQVNLVLNNVDGHPHDLNVDTIPIVTEHPHAHHHTGEQQPDLHLHANPGQTDSQIFTPTQEGEYSFYCTVPGHKDGGMSGKIIVKP